MISERELIELWVARRAERSPTIQAMSAIQSAYEGAVVVPLPQIESSVKSTVANLIQQGLDHSALGAVSTLPMIGCDPANPRLEGSKRKAELRRKALYGLWDDNKMGLKLRRRARHLIGHGCSPVVVRPNDKKGIPVWDVRDPLTCYPAMMADVDALVPDDVIFTYRRRAVWVRKHYELAYSALGRPTKAPMDAELTVLEYHSADEMVMMVVSDFGAQGGSSGWVAPQGDVRKAFNAVIERAENKVGRTQVVIPGRITLGRLMGQFDGVLPMVAQQAHLEALQISAIEKDIYPDAYLVSRPNEVAKFITGPFDGRTGLVNVVEGGTVEYIHSPASTQANVAIDRLERNQRVTSGVPAEWGGESSTNVRTGRRGEAIMSAQIDLGIQETQEILAASLQEENSLAIDVYKAHFGATKRSFSVQWKDAKGAVEFIPKDDFESSQNSVVFPAGGRDASGFVIAINQRVGVGTMSKETAQELDPMISDPMRERQRVMTETVDTAILASISALAQSGQMAPQDAAMLKRRLVLGDSIEDALDAVQKAAQQRQSQEQAVPKGAPEAQAGIAPAGLGAEQGTIPAPNSDSHDLARMLTDLRGPSRQSPAERGAA